MRTNIAITKSWIALALAAWLLAPALCAQDAQDAGSTAPGLRPYGENLRQWQGLSDEQRQAIRDRAGALTPGQLDELRRRLAEFKNLPPEDQERLRGNCHRFRGLRPGERGKLEQGYAQFRELPEEKKAELRRQFRMRRRGAPTEGPKGAQPPTEHGGPHRRGQGGRGAAQEEGNLERGAGRRGAVEDPPKHPPAPPGAGERRAPERTTPGQSGHPPGPGQVRKKPGTEDHSQDTDAPEGAKSGGKGDGPADSGQKKQRPADAPDRDRAGWKKRPGGPPDRSGGGRGGNRSGNRNGRGGKGR